MGSLAHWLHQWVPDGRQTALLLSAIVVLGAIAGELIARSTRLPRVVGYTLAGWIPALANSGATIPLEPAVQLLVDLALALLLFEIGSRARLRWLRHNPGLLLTSAMESLAAAFAAYAALRWIDVPPRVAVSCAVLAVPASAALCGHVTHEIGADGQATQRLTVLTALNTLYGVLAFVVLKGWIEMTQAPGVLSAAYTLVVAFLGSLALAAALALAVAVATRRLDLRQEGSALLLLGLVLLAQTTAGWLNVSTLLVPLLAGLLLRSSSRRAWSWPQHLGTAGGLLVLLLFFVVGSAWRPQYLATGGLAALALLAARASAKTLVVWLLSWPSHLSMRKGLGLSLTLTPLSATALVTLSELARADPALGGDVTPIVLPAIATMELLGPIAALLALRAAGEVAAPGRKAETH